MNEARIDKWLWAVRIFKTRSIAAEACKKGHVNINSMQAKASKTVKVGDTVSVKKAPITYSYKVLQTIEKRVGAKLVPEMLENITSQEQYELLEMSKISGFVNRARGQGRPTKRERRKMNDFISDNS
jgi:ribosome-associated heat shock protein Hsp15